MILHLANLEKFIPPFIDLVHENFADAPTRQLFLLFGDHEHVQVPARANTVILKRFSSWRSWRLVLRNLYAADKIFLHGLFELKIVILLALQPWLLKKCYWWIWGNDLYKHIQDKRNFSWRWKECFRAFVIKRMGHLVTYVDGDVALARKWYGAKGKYHECLLYTSNIYHEYNISAVRTDKCTIQLGNSATVSNEHLDALEKLRPFAQRDIEIVAPLSYGNAAYGALVAAKGKEIFGDKFTALTGLMPFPQYLAFLATIDIALFNHSRQQGMGNLLTLAGLGKKLYLRPETTAKAFFDKIDVKVFDIDKLDLTPLDPIVQANNIAHIKQYCSRENLIAQLGNLFDGE